MGISESAWLKTLPRENESWVKQLFERYYVSLVMFAQTYVQDREIAKDIVQDIFLILIKSKEKFTSIENLKIYLYSAVKNKCLKHIRHENVKERYQHYVRSNEEQERIYQERILDEEVYNLLNQAIEGLPPQCKNVILLTLEGKNNTEIAESLKISIETVKSHKKSGKKMLYLKLKGSLSLIFVSIIMDL